LNFVGSVGKNYSMAKVIAESVTAMSILPIDSRCCAVLVTRMYRER